ncbi:MAG: alpha/beta hydrolase [Alphaproteobacteria bacterium]|nr:alpha/beta hydrolase [Alphaproteobacteria bacterium]
MANAKYVDVAGVRTRYVEAGAGAPLVMIHGGAFGTGSSLDIFVRNIEPLAERYRVIAYDKIGHGYTDNPPEADGYTVRRMTAHAIAFIDALGLKDAYLIGQSRGAYNGIALALARPDLVRAFVLCNSASLVKGVAADPQFSRDVRAKATHPVGSPAWVRYRTEAMCMPGTHIDEAWVEAWHTVWHLPKSGEARAALAATAARVFEPDFAAEKAELYAAIEAGRYRTPTLIYWGKNDPSAPFDPMGLEVFERLSDRCAPVSLHVANRAGHFAFREAPAEFNRVVASFFDAV